MLTGGCQRGISGFRRGGGVPTRDLAAHVPILLVDGLVLGFVGGAHVPVEAVLESGRVVVVLDLFKLYRLARDCAGGLDEMCFGFGDEPVGEGCWDVGPFLAVAC